VAALAGDQFEVDVRGGGQVVVVALADRLHGEPVVVLRAEGIGEDGDEDERGEQRDHVPCKHGVVGAGGVDVEFAALLLRGHEPGDESAGETEDRGEGGRGPVLLAPHEGQSGGKHGGGDDDAHQ